MSANPLQNQEFNVSQLRNELNALSRRATRNYKIKRGLAIVFPLLLFAAMIISALILASPAALGVIMIALFVGFGAVTVLIFYLKSKLSKLAVATQKLERISQHFDQWSRRPQPNTQHHWGADSGNCVQTHIKTRGLKFIVKEALVLRDLHSRADRKIWLNILAHINPISEAITPPLLILSPALRLGGSARRVASVRVVRVQSRGAVELELSLRHVSSVSL